MPQPAVGSVEVRSRFCTELVWNVDLALTDVALDVVQELGKAAEMLPGVWSFSAKREGSKVSLYVYYGELSVGQLGSEVSRSMKFEWVGKEASGFLASVGKSGGPFPRAQSGSSPYTRRLLEVKAGDWDAAAASSMGAYNPGSHRSYRLTVTLQQGFLGTDASEDAPELAIRLAERLHGAIRSPPSLTLLSCSPDSIHRSQPRTKPSRHSPVLPSPSTARRC
jgi:hypothetical protein